MNARVHKTFICANVVSVPFADLTKLTVTKVLVLDRSLRLAITINAHCALASLGQVKMDGASTYLKARAAQQIPDKHYRKPIQLYMWYNRWLRSPRVQISELIFFIVESPKLNP